MVQVRTPTARHSITVHRDKTGTPHIEAASPIEAIYGLGYLHALDRGTQLLFARAVASGRGSERIADHPEIFETDCFFRRIGLHTGLEEDAATLAPDLREQIEAYCEGVNDGLQGMGRTLPMWATGFQPNDWDVHAVLLVGRLLSFGGLAVGQYQHERLLLELIHAGTEEGILRELLYPQLEEVDFGLLRQVHLANQLSDDALELLTDLPRLAGSNAWAVSPERSASRGALLASDPHLEINRLPAIWYEAALRWPGNYVLGATLPGCPLFAVARNKTLGWGVTYMKGDTVDFFVEDCRPGGETGWQYRRGGEWHDFQARREVMKRKGGDESVCTVLFNEVGTLESDPKLPGYYLSVAWPGNRPGSGRAIGTWLELLAAGSVREGMDVVRECSQPTLCFVMADRDGHIGLQGCGTFPRRRRPTDGLVPLPAWDKQNHWQGWLDPSELPSIYDPPNGFVATANESVNRPGGPWLVTQIAPDYRKRRIEQQLARWPRATVRQMQELQYDVYSIQAHDLLQVFLPLLPPGKLVTMLAEWDCRYTPSSRTAPIFQRLYINVMMEVLGQDEAIGWRRMVYLASRTGYSSMILAAADRFLLHHDSDWWRHRDLGAMVAKAAARIDLDANITWADVNNFHFIDRFFGTNRAGRMLGFRSRQITMPGTTATPFQGHVCQTANRTQTFAPSYHFVTDMCSDHALTNLPGGPSESRFSRYYRSHLGPWLRGQYKRLTADPDLSGSVDIKVTLAGAPDSDA